MQCCGDMGNKYVQSVKKTCYETIHNQLIIYIMSQMQMNSSCRHNAINT